MKVIVNKVIKWLSNYEIQSSHAVVLLIVLITIFFSPLLFFSKILLNGDATYLAYPSAYFFNHFFGSPINNFLFSGYPVPIAFEYGYFHPLNNLFFYLFDFLFAYHALLYLDFIGAAIFTYFFSRKIGLSVPGSLIGAMAYTFSQLSTSWLGVLSVTNATFLLPAIMYSILQVVELKKRFVVIFGLILGCAFLGTHYQFIIIALLGAGALFLFEVWKKWDKNSKFLFNVMPFVYMSIVGLIGLIVSIPQAMSSLNFFSESGRVAILTYSSAPYIDLFKYLIPSFKIPFISIEEFRPYVGFVPLFFSIIGLYNIFTKKITNERAKFFAWFFVVSLVISLQYSPLLLIIEHIPLVKYFVGQSRWAILSNFAIVIMAAFGFDYIANRSSKFSTRTQVLLKKLSIVIVSFFVAANVALYFISENLITYTKQYFDLNLYAGTTHLPLSYYHGIIESMAQNAFLNVSFLNPNVLLLCTLTVCLYLITKFSNKRISFSNLIIIITSVNMLFVSFFTYKTVDRSVLTDKSAIANFIQSKEINHINYRVFSLGAFYAQYQQITALNPGAETDALVFARESLIGNLNVFSEIPIVGGYNPMALRRYLSVVEYLENATDKTDIQEKNKVFANRLNLLSAFNVKYVVSPYILESSDLSLVFSEKVTSFEVPLYLYQNKRFINRFYFANKVLYLPENNESANFKTVTGAKSDFQDVSFVECDNCGNFESTSTKFGKLEIISETDTRFVINTNSSKEEWLVISNEAVPGWVATIDGQNARIYYANHAFQAVHIPKGKHTVVLSYSAIPKLPF